ncbi:zinc-dependent metalloprotease [Actinomyces qiguomingii]|uniref:zinc-dependent metalloprotease n=1 Tax=Actinomyces qiguomingii TaxID=2057800 RepID=UPI001E46AC80|nr:zinc-dependent metalloprotease [Actinomyces qiguomingii]
MSELRGGPVDFAASRGDVRGRAGSDGAATGSSAADGVDWDAALGLARLATPAGPRVPRAVGRGVVALLRRSAEDALPWAAQITGLTRAGRLAADVSGVLVVDRAGLQRANAAFLRELMGRVPEPAHARLGPSAAIGRGTAGLAVAGLLGLVSTRVLGQVLPGETGPGGESAPPGSAANTAAGARTAAPRMLLVAPNVLDFQRRWDLDRLDLSAWVTLHEAAHVLQLTEAHWLAEHLAVQVTGIAQALVRRPAAGGPGGLELLARAWRAGASAPAGVPSPLLTERLGVAERERLAAVAATMALLEGHAEAVLDAVQPSRMPSVHRLRAVLGRSPNGAAGTMLERLVGVEAKRAQYVDGAAFVRAVVGRVGHAGLNVVWRRAENLPRPAEISRPEVWIERMGL